MQIQEDEGEIKRYHVIYGALTVIAVMVAYGLTVAKCISNYPNQGLFGDMFGALNCAFTGMAFVGVLFNVSLQRKQVNMQRDEILSQRNELEETRKLQADQRDHMATQARVLHQQAVESTLFNLLAHHTGRILGEVEFYPWKVGATGTPERAKGSTAIYRFLGAITAAGKVRGEHSPASFSLETITNARQLIGGLRALLFSLAVIYEMIEGVSDADQRTFYKRLLMAHISDEEFTVVKIFHADRTETNTSTRKILDRLVNDPEMLSAFS